MSHNTLKLHFDCLYEKPMPDCNIHRGHIWIDGKQVPVVVTMMSEDTIYSYFRAASHFGPYSEWTFYCRGDIRGLAFQSDHIKLPKPSDAVAA